MGAALVFKSVGNTPTNSCLLVFGTGSTLTCEKIAKERYKNMMKQQKLTNISKEQAEQILVLQAEVERLRMKTFPALVNL